MMMPFMYKPVICFDLDDTLYKEQDFLKSAFQEIAVYVESCINVPYENIYNVLISAFQNNKNAFDALNEQYNIHIPIETYLKIYREHKPNILPLPGVLEMLAFFKNKGSILGLISDGRSVTQRNKIKSLKIECFFNDDNIIISEEFGTSKPSKSNYQYFSDRYPGRQFFYIGDNTHKDFVVPNELGWTSICLLDDGNNIHQQDFLGDESCLPSYRIHDIKEVIDILKKVYKKF